MFQKLTGRIIERYGTRAAFARASGISPCRISHILNGRADWSREEILEASKLLLIGQDEIGIFFYPDVPKMEH